MTDATLNTRSANKANVKRWIVPACIAAVVAGIALDTKIVTVGSAEDVREQVFNPDAFGADTFPRIQSRAIEIAPDAVQLALELADDKAAAIDAYGTKTAIGGVLAVSVTGIAGEGRSGIFPLTVAGLPDGTNVRVQTGPAINGTDLRDFPGDIAFGQFKNQIEFQDAGSGLNRAMAADVLADLDRDNLTGQTVSVTGVFTLINPKNWLITPVAIEVE